MPELHHQRMSQTLIQLALTTQTMDRIPMHCMFDGHIIVPTTRRNMPIISIHLEGHLLIFRVPICVLFQNQPINTCQPQPLIMTSSKNHNPETRSTMSRREERQRRTRTAVRRCREINHNTIIITSPHFTLLFQFAYTPKVLDLSR